MTNLDELSPSDITLTPGTDSVSDYQQYLEKTNPRSSRGEASLQHCSPTGNDELLRHSSLTDTPALTLQNETQLEISVVPTLEGTRPAHVRKRRERHPHGVDATEDSHEYPGPLALSLLTLGICLSVFLVSLDRTIVATVRASSERLGTTLSELNSFPSRPYRASPTIFTLLTMLGGTAARTWSQLALSNLSTGAYSSRSTSNGRFFVPWVCSSLAVSSAELHPIQSHSSWGELLLDGEALAS